MILVIFTVVIENLIDTLKFALGEAKRKVWSFSPRMLRGNNKT